MREDAIAREYKTAGTGCSNYISKDYVMKNLHACIRDRKSIDWLLDLIKEAAEVPWMYTDMQGLLSGIYGVESATTIPVKNGKIKSGKGNTWIGVS